MSNASDFVIENGVLTKYTGPGGDVVIPEGVTEIGPDAFCDSAKTLTAINIPYGVVMIGTSAFKNCLRLISVALPGSLRRIGEKAFYSCSSLKQISIPDNVSEIGEWAFGYCSSLEEFVFPESVTEIKPVLGSCKALKSVVLPKHVTSISEGAFTLLKCSFTIYDWLPDMTKAVDWCTPTAIHTEYLSKIPAKLRLNAAIGYCQEGGKNTSAERVADHEKYLSQHNAQIKNAAFDDPSVLQFLCERKLIKAKELDAYLEEAEKREAAEQKALLLDYQNQLGLETVNKAREKKEKVKEEYEEALVERITTPDPPKGIEGMNFVITGLLSSVWNSRKEAQEYLAFYGAKLGGSVTKATDYLVTCDSDSDSAKSKRAQELGVPVISETAFNEMIGRRFQDAEQIVLPGWLRSIGDAALKDCSSLKNIIIPEGVRNIGEDAFRGCVRLSNVSIPETVTDIGKYAFAGCKSLTSISIPDGVNSIGDGVFSGCEKLEKIRIAEGNAKYRMIKGLLLTADTCRLVSCVGILTQAAIPSGVAEIGDSAFSGCDRLLEVTIPESVRSIGDFAFGDCKCITEVAIPEGVQSMGFFAFRACTSLKKAILPASVQSIGDFAFDKFSLTIHAPKGSFAQRYAKKNNILFVAE